MAAAGSCTITKTDRNSHSGVSRVTFAWTSDGSGDVSGGAALTSFSVYGSIVRVVTDPGSAAPTDNYDIVLNDEHGADVLAAAGANRDTANSETINPAAPIAVDGTLELVVSNAGASKTGSVIVYLK